MAATAGPPAAPVNAHTHTHAHNHTHTPAHDAAGRPMPAVPATVNVAVALTPEACNMLRELSQHGAGADASEIIERLITLVLPEFRSQHTHIASQEAEIARLRGMLSEASRMPRWHEAMQAEHAAKLSLGAPAPGDCPRAPGGSHWHTPTHALSHGTPTDGTMQDTHGGMPVTPTVVHHALAHSGHGMPRAPTGASYGSMSANPRIDSSAASDAGGTATASGSSDEDDALPEDVPPRRRFFKSVHTLDPSARRKRKAKFARALVGLMDAYGMDIDFVHGMVTEMRSDPAVLNKHVTKRARMAEESATVTAPPAPRGGAQMPRRSRGSAGARASEPVDSSTISGETPSSGSCSGKRTRASTSQSALPTPIPIYQALPMPSVPPARAWCGNALPATANMFGVVDLLPAQTKPEVRSGGMDCGIAQFPCSSSAAVAPLQTAPVTPSEFSSSQMSTQRLSLVPGVPPARTVAAVLPGLPGIGAERVDSKPNVDAAPVPRGAAAAGGTPPAVPFSSSSSSTPALRLTSNDTPCRVLQSISPSPQGTPAASLPRLPSLSALFGSFSAVGATTAISSERGDQRDAIPVDELAHAFGPDFGFDVGLDLMDQA